MWIRCVILILSSALAAIKVNCSKENMDSKALSSSIANFSAKFCNELEKNKSVVSSPLSAEFVLGLLALGTTDPAHSELLKSLGLADDDAIRSGFTEMTTKLRGLKGVTLNIANKVYIQDGSYELQPKLKEDAVKIFDAALEKVDFGDNVAAVKNINDWVESKTNHKIKKLLSDDSVDSMTRVVLVNALYFKGTWKNQFDPANTMEQEFHISENVTVQVPMMYKEDDYAFGYSNELEAQLLEIPYVGGEASMLIVLPQEVDGLNDVVAKLAAGHDLMGDVEKMFSTKVQVTIPKFKIETEINLNDLLPKLGIKAIFDQENSGITKLLDSSQSLFVSKAIQKAFIEVNEEGAEAAAATAMGVAFLSAMINMAPVERFVADRPFLVVIFADGAPHFWAHYYGNEE